MAKTFTITNTSLSWVRNPDSLAKEAELDGIYVIRTNVAVTTTDAAEAVRYTNHRRTGRKSSEHSNLGTCKSARSTTTPKRGPVATYFCACSPGT